MIYCQSTNEAVLQRTIMVSLVDRFQLDLIFVYNCEGQWSQQKENLPRSTQTDEVSLPKADLAFFIKLKALVGKEDVAPIPQGIDDCLRPDRGEPDRGQRWFPFLFMEAKKVKYPLPEALASEPA